jgi:hypothetical protein
MVTNRQTPELVRDLMHALTAYNLTKAETLQIVNCPPLSIVELWLVSRSVQFASEDAHD